MSTIGNRIRKKRLELNMTVEELAKKINRSIATTYRYEKDEIEKIPLAIIMPLAEALETTPQYLMGWPEETVVNVKSADMLHMSKYLALDEEGKKTVDVILDYEYERRGAAQNDKEQ